MAADSSPVHRPRLDPQRMALARAYAGEGRRLMLLGLAIGGGYFLLWWAFVHGPLVQRLEAWIGVFDLRVLAYMVLFGGGATLVNFPLSAYAHQRNVYYGLAVQTWASWLLDRAKGLAVSAAISLPLVWALYRLLAAYPSTWWLWMGLLYLGFSVLLVQLAPVLIAPLFFKFTPYADEDLTPRLLALAQQAGAQVRGVFRTDLSSKTTTANAWLSGLGSTRRIVLGDTLLDQYTPDEILAVFAHEMGHHVHRDLGLGILIGSVLNLAGFWIAGQVMAVVVAILGYAGPADLRAFPWLMLSLALFGALTSPLLNAYSRNREWAADRYALDYGPGPAPYADALTRLANQNLADPAPPRWEVLFSYGHPPLLQRIANARQREGVEPA